MNTAIVYHDSKGNERTIHQMVKYEPEWAANRIQNAEKAYERLERKYHQALDQVKYWKEAERTAKTDLT
jgi:hypothetical protein